MHACVLLLLRCRHTIRLLLDKWGIDNVNDLIVDETVDDFEATRFNDIPSFDQKPPNPNQIPTFNGSPNAVPTDGFHHIDGGYNYPNPNKVQTSAVPPPAQPQPVSTAGYLPTNAYTVNHNPGADRYWSGFSYSINQRWEILMNLHPKYAIAQRSFDFHALSCGSFAIFCIASRSHSFAFVWPVCTFADGFMHVAIIRIVCMSRAFLNVYIKWLND